MVTLSPIVIAAGIIVALIAVGAFIAYFRDRRKFRGYEDLMFDAADLAKQLSGEVFRDGEDLVVSGNVDDLPTYVRFSHAETTPGVHIRMEAPANVRLAVAPRSAPPTEGKVQVRTGDESLDTRCVVRCDEPMQTKLFIGEKPVLGELQRLCCSARTYFTVVPGAMELSELTIPLGEVGRHVSEHITSMRRLVPELKKLPGSEKIRVRPLKRERHLVGKAAIAIGVAVAVMAIYVATNQGSTAPVDMSADVEQAPEGIPEAEAQQMGDLSAWRVAGTDDFDGDGVGWLKGFRREASGHVSGKFGKEAEDDAYVLLGKDGTRRLVMFVNGRVKYDTKYPFIGVVARVPKANIGKISWVGAPPDGPDGDGVLIVRNRGDRSSGVIFFSSGERIISGVPVDYQTIDLME